MANDLELIIENKTTELRKQLDNLPKDFSVARENISSIISTGLDAFNDLAELAKQAPLPSTYEALATLMKVTLDANKYLLDIHQTVSKIEKTTTVNNSTDLKKELGTSGNTNIIMVGSTKELLRLLKDKQQQENN